MLQQGLPRILEKENEQFSGTGGVSGNNASACFLPAFMDSVSGRVELSRFVDGRIASCHLLDGLPEEWITQRDLAGRVKEISGAVISGFVRVGRFFTRQEAADFIARLES